MRRGPATFAVVVSLVLASCGGDSATSPASTAAESTPSTSASPAPRTTTATATSISPPTTSAGITTSSTSTPPATTSTTSGAPITTPSTAAPPPTPGCDDPAATEILDRVLELARLAPGEAWTDETTGIAFAARTRTGATFGERVAFECSLRLAQRNEDGSERLALIAWNELRHAAVVQATDAPSAPYSGDAVFQLFIEQPRGEFIVDQFVWAATMSGGESIVISTDDYSAAITAKSWQVEAPDFQDLPVTLEAEQHAIDALNAAGARNVSVAEPAPFGYPIGTIQFNTPLALSAFAVIGATESFDPMVPLLADGDTTLHDAGPVTVRLTTGLELEMFDLFETGWACTDHSWRLYSGLGTPDELLWFTYALIESLQRTGNC